jgi:hypothetical protein
MITFINMKRIITIITFVFCATIAKSQGCSDAGFCTINSFKSTTGKTHSVNYNNQFRMGASVGSADNDITVFSTSVEYSRQLNKSLTADIKMTFLSQSGNNISTAGLSDIFANVNYAVSKKVELILGAKIPLSGANKQKNGLTLPMDYQSSLGTFDVIVGLGYKLEKWKFNIGWQQPLSQNRNTFIAENYPLNSPLHSFQSTNNYSRSGDALLRVSYQFELSKKLLLTPGILPIYHLANDEFYDINGKQIINGSKGLTLNAIVYLNYKINKKNALEFNMGSPLVARDVRPDGLTRSFIATLQYQLSF